jgi:hypothetical protein
MSSSSSSTWKGLLMQAITDSSRKRRASGEKAPPVMKMKRWAMSGQRLCTTR